MKLMIIEGPGKVAAINKNLNDNSFKIFATAGHIKELSKNPKDNDGYGFDFNNFNPVFETISGKEKIIQEMNELGKTAEVIYLASDPDREGEGIAYHVFNALSKENQSKCKRITFEEINKASIVKALNNPRSIDMNLVNAQFARQIFDKLFGYKASRFAYALMKSKDISIGRVQSEALQIICNREEEIKNYQPTYWWTINPTINVNETEVKLNLVNCEQITNKFSSLELISEFIKLLSNQFLFINQEAKEVNRKPHDPFNTATFLEYANKKLDLSAKDTQEILQVTYETGLMTYPRTDSIRMDDEFCNHAYEYVKVNYGNEYADNSYPFNNEKKSKNTQEGHNALRVIDLTINTKELMVNKLKDSNVSKSDFEYERIWKVYKAAYDRTLEVFFKPAIYNQTILTFSNKLSQAFNNINEVKFTANSKVLKFLGWLKYYQNNDINLDEEKDDDEVIKVSPTLNTYYELIANKKMGDFVIKHSDSCPKRFSDGSLINYLQKHGIGRPSTFAQMAAINTLKNNTKIEKKEIVPIEKGVNLNSFNKTCFNEFINDVFTADLEDKLDEIANGNLNWKQLLKNYYEQIEKLLSELAKNKAIEQQYANKEKLGNLANYNCPKCNAKVYIRKDKNGNDYEVCENFRYNNANSCSYIKFLNHECKAVEKCPKCNKNVYKHTTKNGKEFKACIDFSFDKTKSKCDYIVWLTNK